MTQIGTIEYEARVSNVADAKADAQEFADTQRNVGDAADESAASTTFLAGSLGRVASASDEAADQTQDADQQFTLLAGTTTVLRRALGKLGGLIASGLGLGGAAAGARSLVAALRGLTLAGVAGTVSSAIGTITSVGAGFLSWLAAGSAGALAFAGAVGAAVGVLGVYALEVTGALDAVRNFGNYVSGSLPQSVVDGLLTVTSVVAAPLGALGAFITGTIRGGFDRGFKQAGKVIDIFGGAFDRTLGRIDASVEQTSQGITNFLGGIQTTVGNVASGIQSDLTGAFRRSKNRVTGFLRDIRDTVANVGDEIRALVTQARGVSDTVSGALAGSVTGGVVPGVAPGIGGGGGGSGGGGGGGLLDGIPFLASGGVIEQTGVAVVHEGETVVPSGERMGGGSVTVENVSVELSGEFDPSSMSRRELESLASKVGDAIGRKTNRSSGVR